MSRVDPNDPKWLAHIATQSFNLTDITGATIPISLTEVEDYFHKKSNSLIIFGVEIGLCIMLTIVLLLLTKPDKRRTAIFALNITGLILETIRFITSSVQYNSPLFYLAYQVLGDDAPLTNKDYVPPVIYSISTIIWYAVVEVSLVLQVRVVFGAERKLQRILTVVLGFLFGVTAGFKIVPQVFGVRAIIQHTDISPPIFAIDLTGRIMFVITVALSSTEDGISVFWTTTSYPHHGVAMSYRSMYLPPFPYCTSSSLSLECSTCAGLSHVSLYGC